MEKPWFASFDYILVYDLGMLHSRLGYTFPGPVTMAIGTAYSKTSLVEHHGASSASYCSDSMRSGVALGISGRSLTTYHLCKQSLAATPCVEGRSEHGQLEIYSIVLKKKRVTSQCLAKATLANPQEPGMRFMLGEWLAAFTCAKIWSIAGLSFSRCWQFQKKMWVMILYITHLR